MVMLDENASPPAAPWPRLLRNYPIILSVVTLQYIWAVALILDPAALNVTAIRALLLYRIADGPITSPPLRLMLIVVLFTTASLTVLGFFQRRKIYTVLATIPQQFVMSLSVIGLLRFIWLGQFADAVVRTPAFLLADQSAAIFLALFHTWALILIIIHAGD